MLRRRMCLARNLPHAVRATPARNYHIAPPPETAAGAALPFLEARPGNRCGGLHAMKQRSITGNQPRAKPPRLPPFRFAFFSRLSYWCDIRCDWTWAMKSITTTTTISSEVPPK